MSSPPPPPPPKKKKKKRKERKEKSKSRQACRTQNTNDTDEKSCHIYQSTETQTANLVSVTEGDFRLAAAVPLFGLFKKKRGGGCVWAFATSTSGLRDVHMFKSYTLDMA